MAEPRHELIPLTDPERWTRALVGIAHGHAHTWGFCRAVQLTSGRPTYLYAYERDGVRVVCPLAERPFAGGTDVVTPYGFGGFAGSGVDERFAEDWAGFAAGRAWVCGYLALNPVLFAPRGFPEDEVHVHNRLYVMDLGGSAEAVFQRLSRNRRRQLRDWPSVSAGLNHDREELTDFLLATHADFFARREAGSATRFRSETMAAIAELDDVLMVGAGRAPQVEAVAVFGYTPHGGDALLNVSVPGGERHAAHLTWWGVEQLRARGVANLNLGGGIREGDDVAEFKRRFGAAELPLVSLRQVYRPEVYEALCRRSGVSPSDRSGYFPAYRG